jgi:hypothetical protein
MRIHRPHLVALLGLSMAAAACNTQPKEDPRVAELQKELAATKEQLAATAKTAEETAAATAASAAAGVAAAETQAQQAAEQARDRAATEKALADQKADAARQEKENAALKRELEEMKPREFTLPAGTVIPVRTTAELSTKSLKNGSVFDGLLETDLVVDRTVLAKAGSRVSCIVVSSDPGGRVKGVASLAVAARSIAGANGNTINVKTDSYSVDANRTRGRDAARTGIATGVGAAIGAIAGGGSGAAIGAGAGAAAGVGTNMATRGEAAVIPTETLIQFTLSAPATVVFRK